MLKEFAAGGTFWKLAKVPELPILADLEWIQRKHPGEFDSPDAVAEHIRFVLASEALIPFKGKAKHSLGFARLEDRRGAVVQLMAKTLNGKRVYQVLTAYTLTPGQISRALDELGDAPGVDPDSSGQSSKAVGPGFRGRPSEPASHRKGNSTPEAKPRKTNPSHAESRQKATGAATGWNPNPEDGSMRKTTTGRTKAASTSKERGPKAPAATSRAKKPVRPISRIKANPEVSPALVKLVDQAAAATTKAHQVAGAKAQQGAHWRALMLHRKAMKAFAKHPEALKHHTAWAKKHQEELARLKKKANPAPKSGASTKRAAKRKPGRSALVLNPSDDAGLAKVWKAWTGAEPGQSLRIDVEEPSRYGLPSRVVLLGRVSWFATKGGKETRFGVSGPYMVTDAKAAKVWLVSHKGHRFDLEPALIGYTARKPKFGDKATVEYVHAFEGRAHAVMDGQVGALTGTFRITPAGLEG